MNKIILHEKDQGLYAFLRLEKRGNFLITILIIIIGAFYTITIRDGHNWGGDFALYISHAKNIAMGNPYSDTNYIYNQNYEILSPRQYPPVFPIFLSIVYKIYGFDLFHMKMMNIIAFLLSIYVYYYTIKKYAGENIALFCSATFAFMPYIWQFKDNILSEYIFTLFSICALGLWEVLARHGERRRSTVRVVALSLAVSAFIALSYGTRSIGIILLPAMMIHGIVLHRKIRLESWIIGLLVASFYLIYNYYTKTDSAYLTIFKSYYLSQPYYSFIYYLESLISLWSGNLGGWNGDATLSSTPLSTALSTVANIVTLPLMILGFITVNRKYISSINIFVILYCIILLIFPAHESPRYLIPIIPWLVYYMISGIVWIANFFKRGRRVILSIFFVFLSATYVSAYASIGFSPMVDGIDKKENRELFAFIKETTSTSDVIVFQKPRVLALYTGRKSAGYNPRYRGDPWPILRKITATYLVVPTPASLLWRRQGNRLAALVSEYPKRVKAVFHNADFTVYKIR